MMHLKLRRPSNSTAGRRQRGVAVVELAVCLPVLALVLLATVETCVMLQLQQNLAVTAYEGARIGIIPGVNAANVELQCQMLLEDRSIHGYSIAMTPPDLATMKVGDVFTLTVQADCAANSVFGGLFYQNRILSESAAMRAE